MRVGERTFLYDHPPRVAAHASIVGPKESEGPLAAWFDEVSRDDLFGQKTWEMGESEMLRRCVARAMTAADVVPRMRRRSSAAISTTRSSPRVLPPAPWACRLVASTVPARRLWRGWVLAAALVSGGYLQNALCAASSHFCTAERQFRFPLEMGHATPALAQWTATAAGCALLAAEEGPGLRVTAGTLGASSIARSRMPTTWARPWLRRWKRPFSPIWTTPAPRRTTLTSSPPATSAGSAARYSCGCCASAGARWRRKSCGGLRRVAVLSGTGYPRGRQRLRLRGGGPPAAG